MKLAREHTCSPWMETDILPGAPRLDSDLSADVLIAGAGIAGLSVAYELLSRGRQVVVIDRAGIGQGMTARTTAHLCAISNDGYGEFIRRRGEEMARLFHESHATAIARIASIAQANAMACNVRRIDGLCFPGDARGRERIAEDYDAARRLGIEAFHQQGLPFAFGERMTALRYPGQASFNPALYLRSLAAAIIRQGGQIFAATAAATVEEGQDRVTVKTLENRRIRANCAVIATHSPINDLGAIHTRQVPCRRYAIALTLPRAVLPDALYWDTRKPHHQVRIEPRGPEDLLIVSGEDHKSGAADDGQERLARLESWTRALLPHAGRVTHRWSGQVMEPVDHVAFIGRNPGSRNIYVATGDSGQGMTHGVVAGLLLAELITAGRHRWETLYEPSRMIPSAPGGCRRENATAARTDAEKLKPDPISSPSELKAGEGAIMREGVHLVAVCRDADGKLHRHSASCTHAGCIVHWNSTERCWDCPCHGSHFAADGSVLNGPAVKPLAPSET